MLTWRKAYRKYKPRTVLGKCNICAKKSVKQAYCTVCHPCAKAQGLCEKCGTKPSEVRAHEPGNREGGGEGTLTIVGPRAWSSARKPQKTR